MNLRHAEGLLVVVGILIVVGVGLAVVMPALVHLVDALSKVSAP